MHLTKYVQTRHEITLRASKCTPCTPLLKVKRSKCVQITVDTEDLITDKYDATRTDATFHVIKTGKCYGQCKFHSLYPECTLRTMRYLFLDDSKTYEEKGKHNLVIGKTVIFLMNINLCPLIEID